MRIIFGWILGGCGILTFGLGMMYIGAPAVELHYRLRSALTIVLGLSLMYIAYKLSDEGRIGK